MDYFRTDLACESLPKSSALDGCDTERFSLFGIEGIYVNIKSESAQKALGRKSGKYITLFTGKAWLYPTEERNKVTKALSECIKRMIKDYESRDFLVVGLGNRFITSDSLGPLCVDKMVATAHIKDEKILSQLGKSRVALIAPAVSGQTGISSCEIIKSAIKLSGAKVLIVIDALCARDTERLCTTVQISDTGLTPGSGTGTLSAEISKETAGIPVISVGVPTVVNSSAIIYDALRTLKIEKVPKRVDKMLKNGVSYFVSPKDSDIITEEMSRIIASAITEAIGNKVD